MKDGNGNPITVRRTQCPLSYLSPNPHEMRQMAARLEIKHFSKELVSDLAHVAAGGEVLTEGEWIPAAQQSAIEAFTRETPDSDGHYQMKGKGAQYISDRETAENGRIQEAIAYHRNVCDFLRNVDFSKVPGTSPLEQALNLLKLLYPSHGDHNAPTSDRHPLPVFCESETAGNHTAETLNEILDTVDSLDTTEKQLIETDVPSKASGLGEGRDLQRMQLASDMAEGKHIWLKVSRNLDFSAKMNVQKSVKFVPDREGDEVRVRPIANFGEFPKIQASEYALPNTYRMYRAAAKVSPIRERVRREAKQQLLYMIIDTSASMHADKIHKAGGVLMNRLKAVVSGDAQVYARFFDTQLYDESFASTPAEAKHLIAAFNANNFSGGGTDIPGCARKAHQRIEEILAANEILTRPELVIVTDGEDDLDALDSRDFSPTTVHAFVIDNDKDELIEFARSTGGIGVHL